MTTIFACPVGVNICISDLNMAACTIFVIGVLNKNEYLQVDTLCVVSK